MFGVVVDADRKSSLAMDLLRESIMSMKELCSAMSYRNVLVIAK